jgi:hypothetical protein
MTKVDPAEIPASKRPRFAANAPIMISQDAARQGPMGHQVLYVLGFGLAGAIFANALTLQRAKNDGDALSAPIAELVVSIASMDGLVGLMSRAAPLIPHLM